MHEYWVQFNDGTEVRTRAPHQGYAELRSAALAAHIDGTIEVPILPPRHRRGDPRNIARMIAEGNRDAFEQARITAAYTRVIGIVQVRRLD